VERDHGLPAEGAASFHTTRAGVSEAPRPARLEVDWRPVKVTSIGEDPIDYLVNVGMSDCDMPGSNAAIMDPSGESGQHISPARIAYD
jgi:hypothetical protein